MAINCNAPSIWEGLMRRRVVCLGGIRGVMRGVFLMGGLRMGGRRRGMLLKGMGWSLILIERNYECNRLIIFTHPSKDNIGHSNSKFTSGLYIFLFFDHMSFYFTFLLIL
jgi:hypothetical protein